MPEYLGGDYIDNILSNDAALTALIGTALYNARMVPETETSDKTVNFYLVGTFDAAIEYGEFRWSASCRDITDYGALEIALAVKDAINRVSKTLSGNKFFATVNILPVIGPVDDTDSYNCPVEILVKRN